MSKDDLVVVTQNKHKLRELTPLFNEYGVKFDMIGLAKFEIRSDDVVSVAREAARHAYQESGRPVVVDDTGLYIDALNGFPKAYPAFVLETIGNEGILKLLKGGENRDATFVSAVGFCDGTTLRVFKGTMKGTISHEEIGNEGFGYDPIFIPDGYSMTYAQLGFEEKTAISHRTQAFRGFLEWYVKKH